MTDILSQLRHAEAQAKAQRMSRQQKTDYLRDHGWRRLFTSGTQRWRSPDGQTATLSGATAIQLAQDLANP